jgi:serine/threonine protein kinase/tetratricopeptide (TPR) repeat protein
VASEPVGISQPVRFGDDFELDLRSYELRRSGRALKLERIPMELLLLLIEQRGQLVSRDQIIERVWGKDVFLDTDNSINAAIRKIRQVLKDDPEQPRYVQTVTGRGYRFIAKIVEPEPPIVALPPAEQPSVPDRLIGRKISHYRILQVLGGGGMGVVYQAEDLKLGRRVAIKFLPTELASDPKAFERLEREARAASSLDHRNICSIYELGEYEGQPFIVMQLLEGRTLREWIEEEASKSGAHRQRDLLDVAIQIADGLDAAHQKGIIHRDIKPANAFVTKRGEVKILDFGVAKFLEIPEPPLVAGSPQDNPPHANLTLTRTGASLGTPSYLSPEQIRGDKLDARTDIFSFGLVLYEMATGKRAFAGNTVTVIREAVLNQPAPPARQLNPELPPTMEAIIGKALEKARDRRFQSASELRTALEKLKADLEPAPKQAIGRRMWLAAGVAAIVLLAGILYFTDVRQRLWRAASSPSSLAEIKPRRAVAVVGFKNLSGNPDKEWISTALAEMFSTELAAGRQLRTIPGENVARMKLDLSLPPADSFSRDTLNKISNHLTVDLVVVGSYLAVEKDSGRKVRIDLQLQDAHAGETVAVFSQDGTETDLADLVSRTGASLRQTLGVAVVASADAEAVKASFPTNAEAARLYSEGLTKLRAFDALAARDLLEKAIAADPNHALSHSALAEAWSALGYDAKAQDEAKRAFDLSAGLSREDRLSIEGRYRELSHDFVSAIEIYRTLRNFFPDDLDYGLRLASTQTKGSAGKDALQTIARMREAPKPASDDPRIDLEEEAAAEPLGDFHRAQQAAATAVAKAQAKGNRLLMAEATEREGWTWDRLGDLDKAAKEMSQARDLAVAVGNPRISGRALRGMGNVLYDKGDFAGARKAFAEALGIFQEIGAQRQVSSTLETLGNVFYDQGKMEEARQYYERALRINREIPFVVAIASNLGSIANVLDALGDLAGATRMQEQSLQAFRETGNKRGEAATLDNLGSVLLERGELGSAKKYFDQAMALGDQIGFKRGRGFVLISLAELLVDEDQLDEARAAAEEAVTLRKELKDEVNLARSQTQLAAVALEQGKVAEAASLARTAAGVFDAQKIADGGTLAQAVLTRALLAQGRRNDAQAAADRALALSHQTPDRPSRFVAGIAVAEVDTESGRSAQASRGLESVLDEAMRYGYTSFELETRLCLGELELRSSNAAHGRARLQELHNLAQLNGFLRIARKAATLSDLTAGPRSK